MEPNYEAVETQSLTGKPRLKFAELYAQKTYEAKNKAILKALRRAPETAEWIAIRVTGSQHVMDHIALGWELVSEEKSLANAGARYFMRRRRADVLLDLELHR